MEIGLYPKYIIRSLFVHGKHDFFAAGYKLLYPEYSKHGMSPWQHYVMDGKRKGFDNGNHPSDSDFFSGGYELEYPDVKAANFEPWHHYAINGLKEGRDNGLHPGKDLFFAEGYLEMYPDVAKDSTDPWRHYVLKGKKEGRDNGLHPGKDLFFAEGYLEMYPDVAQAKIDPWQHYVLLGKKEGRDNGLHPGKDLFFAEGYLKAYPDVAKDNIDPWHHYVLKGKKEGRSSQTNLVKKVSSFENYTNWIFDVHENKTNFVKNDGRVFRRKKSDPKIFAYYLPQFHAIPINDQSFGKGFTEWTNVSRATPLFYGHVQPRVPYDLGFYNLENIHVLERQVELAKQYGVYGFCFYYYWFSGKKVLDKPLQMFLDSKIDFKFHLMWANENWAKRWDGVNKDIILEQKFNYSEIDDFYRDLLPFIKDERYEKIDNKPILAVYRVALFGEKLFQAFVTRLNELAIKDGFDGFYFLGTNSFDFVDPQKYALEGLIEFPPHGMIGLTCTNDIEWFNLNCKVVVYDMHKWIDAKGYLNQHIDNCKMFKCCFPSWDNSPRKAYIDAAIFIMQQNDFYNWLSGLVRWTKSNYSENEQYVYINAWNEWGEGAVLEPDTRFGYRSLVTVRKVLEDTRA